MKKYAENIDTMKMSTFSIIRYGRSIKITAVMLVIPHECACSWKCVIVQRLHVCCNLAAMSFEKCICTTVKHCYIPRHC